MKKFLVLFAMVAFVGSFASAQTTKTCTKSKAACTKSKTACTKSKAAASTVSAKELPACSVKAAAQLASMDETISAKTCATSGHTTYYKKSVCAASGKVSMKEVKYCSTSKGFVNVAPSATAKTVSATGTAKKSCAKKCAKSKATCSKAQKAACSKSKAASTEVKATQVKLEEK